MAICIAELLSRLGLEVIERPPLKKCWAGKDKKITTDELFRIAGLSFNKKRTNQEERDACLLALYYSFIQLRLLNKKTDIEEILMFKKLYIKVMNKLTATEIKEIIEKTFNLKFIELKSKSRLPKIVYARVPFCRRM